MLTEVILESEVERSGEKSLKQAVLWRRGEEV
jgi:hypothetical protein